MYTLSLTILNSQVQLEYNQNISVLHLPNEYDGILLRWYSSIRINKNEIIKIKYKKNFKILKRLYPFLFRIPDTPNITHSVTFTIGIWEK